MGTTSSAQRDSKCEADAADQPNAGQNQVEEDNAEDKLLQNNGQISTLNVKTDDNQDDNLNGCCEEKVLAEVCSGFVTLEEDNTETTEDLKDGEAHEGHAEDVNEGVNDEDAVTLKKENQGDNKLDDVEVGFKKFFRFIGFRFTLKKDKCDKTDGEKPTTTEHDKNVAIPSEDSKYTSGESVSTNEQDSEGIQKESTQEELNAESKAGDSSPEADNEVQMAQISEITEYDEKNTSNKGLVEEVQQKSGPEEPMSPFKRFFTQGIFAIGKRRKEEQALKEDKEEDLRKNNQEDNEKLGGPAKDDNTCVCLDVSNITAEEPKDLQTGGRDDAKLAVDEELMNTQEPSPLKRLFRKLSIRRHKETKPVETNVTESGENLNEKPQSSTELVLKEEEETKVEELKHAEDEQIMDISPEESKKKSDSNVSWEALICGGSSKKRVRKTSDSEDETQEIAEEPRKTESPLVSSNEGDYDHLTSSSEQAGSSQEGEGGSTWKSLKKLVTPKRKGRVEESGSPDQIPTETEITKDESSCSIKNLIPGRKKRKFDGQQEHTSTEEGGKDNRDIEDDDETPVVVPLSEYEITEPETLAEKTVERTVETELQPIIEEDKTKKTKPLMKPSHNAGPAVVVIPSDYAEELTEFISKHQQLSDIPEEGIVEESVVTPVSSAEWATQDDTLAEDIVELTADAVTAPEPAEEFDDETTEMVSAVSQLTESPKSSENVTPVLAKHDMSKSDVILQEVVETMCMTPNVLSVTTKSKDPEALAVSVSPCIVESTKSTETKLLVAHQKADATSICIGLDSQEIAADEEVLPLPIVEGISEIGEAVPTELVCEDLADESGAAGITTDDVYEVQIKEIKTELQEAILPEENNISLMETKVEAEQAIQKHSDSLDENVENGLSRGTHVEDLKEYPLELLHDIQELTPVHMAFQDETQLLEEHVVTKPLDRPETEAPLETSLEEAVLEEPAQCTVTFIEGEKEQRLPDVELLQTDIEQVALAEVTVPVEHNVIISVPDSSIYELTKSDVQVTLAEVGETVTPAVVVSRLDTILNEASEITEQMTGLLASAVECSETTEAISIVSPVSDLIKEEVEHLEEKNLIEKDPSLQLFHREIQVEVMDEILEKAKENIELVLCTSNVVVEVDVCEKEEKITEEVTAQQLEPIPTVESGESITREIVDAENSETVTVPPSEEMEQIAVIEEPSPPVTITEDKIITGEEPEAVSEVTFNLEKVGTDITPIDNLKSEQSIGDETYMVSPNESKEDLDIVQSSVISEQQSPQEELTEEAPQPITIVSAKLDTEQDLEKDSEVSADKHITEAVPESVEEQLDVTGIVKDVKELISEDVPEHKEGTTKPEVSFEITVEHQESVEAPPAKIKPHIDKEQQTELVPSIAEDSHVPESTPPSIKEEGQGDEDVVKVAEVISDVAVTPVEKTEQMTILSSTDEDVSEHRETTAKPEVSVEIPIGPQKSMEAHTPSPEIEPHVHKEQQTQLAPSIVEDRHVPESTPLPNEENADIVKVTKAISDVAVIQLEETEQMIVVSSTDQKFNETKSSAEKSIVTETEGKELSEQPVKTELGEDNVTLPSTESICRPVEAPLKLDQEPEASVTSEVVQVKEVSQANIPQISAEIVSQQKPELTIASEQNKGSADVTGQENTFVLQVEHPVISKLDLVTPAVIEQKKESIINTAETERAMQEDQITESSCTEKENRAVPVTEPEEPQQTELAPSIAEDSHVSELTQVVMELKEEVTAPVIETPVTEVISGVAVTHVEEAKQMTILSSTDEDVSEHRETTAKPEVSVEIPIGPQKSMEAHTPSPEIEPHVHKEQQQTQLVKAETAVALVKVETAVVSELTVMTPVVVEHEVETPVETSEAKTVDTITLAMDSVTEKQEALASVCASEVETPVETSEAKTVDTITLAMDSVTEEQEALASIREPEVGTKIIEVEATTPRETSAMVPETQSEKVVPAVSIPTAIPVLQEAKILAETSEEKGTKIQITPSVEVTESKIAMDVKAERMVQTTVVVKQEAQIPVVTSAFETEGLVGHKVESVVSISTVIPVLQQAKVLAETTDEKGTKIQIPELKMEMPVKPETMVQATVVTEQEAQTPVVTAAFEKEGLVGLCVEKDLDPKTTAMTLTKEEKLVVSPILTSVVSESLPITAVTPVASTLVQTPTTVPTIHTSADVPLVEEPEVETHEAVEVITPKTETTPETEIKIHTTAVQELELQEPCVASVVTELNAKLLPVNTEVEPSIITTVVSVVTTPTVTQAAQAPAMVPTIRVPTVVQIPAIVATVQPLATKEESPVVSEAKESHVDVPAAAEIKSSSQTEPEVTKTTEQVTKNVESEPESKENKGLEAVREESKELAVPKLKTTESLPEVEDDVWEDAVDDIRDDGCCITEVSSEFQDTTM